MSKMSKSQLRRLAQQRKIEEERIEAAEQFNFEQSKVITDPALLAAKAERLASVLGARVKAGTR